VISRQATPVFPPYIESGRLVELGPIPTFKFAKVGICRVYEMPKLLEPVGATVQEAKYRGAHDFGGGLGSTVPMRRLPESIFQIVAA
jgi:hypothetical protein